MFEHIHFRLTRHVLSLKFQRFKKYCIISMMFPIGFDVCIRKKINKISLIELELMTKFAFNLFRQ